jgi:diguanylate cyclase (GGDEF)-like protein
VRALVFAEERLPRWAVHCLLACGTLLVEWIVLAGGDPDSPYPVLYLWVATFAFCFLPRTEAAAHGVLVAVAYAVGLALVPGGRGSDFIRWILFSLVVAVGGGFIGTLRSRHDRLMENLRTVSRTDELTGLFDRRGFEDALASEIARTRGSGSRFAVIVATVDSFDTIPEAKRNAILVATGRAIADAKRGIDTAARLGGCEFGVVATYTDERGADVLAERIRGYTFDATGGGATVSLGVVSHPRHGGTADMLMIAARSARADAAGLGGDRTLVALSSADEIDARMGDVDVQVLPLVSQD